MTWFKIALTEVLFCSILLVGVTTILSKIDYKTNEVVYHGYTTQITR